MFWQCAYEQEVEVEVSNWWNHDFSLIKGSRAFLQMNHRRNPDVTLTTC
jgi:hypothetical protein